MAGPSPFDLVRLADLGVSEDPDGSTQRLITAISRTILTALNRPALLPQSYTEIRTGGGSSILLANWPVTAVARVAIGAVTLSPASGSGSGYTLQPADDAPPGRPQLLTLPGRPGPVPVTMTYTAGYQVSAEPALIPAAAPYALSPVQPYGAWASDCGVTYGTGRRLARVAAKPARGQYAVDAAATYTFSTDDAGAAVVLSYGYVPADLANAALDWIRDRLAYAERVGMQSKSLGGQETVSYRITALPDFVSAALQPYRSVVPPC